MKTIPLVLLMIAHSCTYLAAQTQMKSSPKLAKQILFDFRTERTGAPLKIPLTTQRNILSKVFRKYLTDEGKCNSQFNVGSSSDPLKAARDAGQIVPLIVDMATGSFTTPGRRETAYIISVSECNASHADNFGTKRVAIFAGQELIANVDADFKTDIVRKTDLNGDGLDELLMTSSDMHQGVLSETAALVEFQNGRVRIVEDFGTVTDDSCASGVGGSSSKASVISMPDLVPGKMPRLQVDNYEAGCRKAKRWRFFSTGKMESP